MEPFSIINVKYQLKSKDDFEKVEIKMYDYSDLSVVMLCDESFGKSFSENFKTIGKYNGKLKIGKGWVFSKSKYSELQQLINDIITFKIKGETPIIYSKKISLESVDGPLGVLPSEPLIIKDFKKFMNTLNSPSKGSYTINGKSYIWGEIEDIDKSITEMNKISDVIMEIKSESHSFVIYKE